MAVAGFCRACGQYVWLNEQWGCVNGHPWSEISNWYDPQTGAPVTPYWLQSAAPAAAPQPVPQPSPAPVAAPAPTPVAAAAAPVPQPAPAPAPESAPAPAVVAPTPAPAPAVTAPAPAPEPDPSVELTPFAAAPSLTPTPAPVAEPEPTPTPAPITASDRLTMLADVLARFGQYPNYRAEYGTDTDIVIQGSQAGFSAIMKAVETEATIYYWDFVGGAAGATAEWDYSATRLIVEDVAARGGWKVEVVAQRESATW